MRIITTQARGMGPLPQIVESRIGPTAVSRLFGRACLPEVIKDIPHARVPLHRMVELYEYGAEVTQDPMFGFDIGSQMAPEDFGIWIRYALAASDLRTALRRLERASAYYQGKHSVILRSKGGFVDFGYAAVVPADLRQTHHADHVILPILQILAAYTSKKQKPHAVLVPYDEPDHHRRLEQRLGLPVFCNPAMTGVTFAAAHLKASLQRPGHQLDQPTFADLKAMVALRPPRNSMELVLAMTHNQLLSRRVSLDETARTLGIGRRTLQRNLSRDGYTFRDVADHARRDRAAALLAEGRDQVGDIALALGYEDQSHFTRAFRRWFGTTPSDFRDRSR